MCSYDERILCWSLGDCNQSLEHYLKSWRLPDISAKTESFSCAATGSKILTFNVVYSSLLEAPIKPGNIVPLPGGIHFGFTRFPYSKCLKMWFVSWSTELIEGAVACADVSGADLVSGSLAQKGGSSEMGKVWRGRWWQGAIQPVHPCNGGEIIQFRGSEVVSLIHSKRYKNLPHEWNLIQSFATK